MTSHATAVEPTREQTSTWTNLLDALFWAGLTTENLVPTEEAISLLNHLGYNPTSAIRELGCIDGETFQNEIQDW